MDQEAKLTSVPSIDPRVSPTEVHCGAVPEVHDPRVLLSQTEEAVLERALAATNGAHAEAARRIGLSRSDFGCKMSKFASSPL